MKQILYIILSVCFLAGCTKADGPAAEERPGQGGDPQEQLSPEFSDPSMRISGPLLTLRWDDFGVVFECRADGAVRGVELASGRDFLFRPGVDADPSGRLTDASLMVNGSFVPLESAYRYYSAGAPGAVWYCIIPRSSEPSEPTWIVVDNSLFN